MPQLLLLAFFSGWLKFLSLSGCTASEAPSSDPNFPYHLDQPDATFELTAEMKEISGLSMAGGPTGASGQFLAAVNDEKGVVFLLDKNTVEIKSRVEFWETGDYEGIEIAGDDAWVVKSSGTLFQVKNFASPNPQVETFKSFLSRENDVEGLAYDSKNQRLLIACKGKGTEDGSPNRAVFAFDLTTKIVSPSPVFVITLDGFQSFLKESGEGDLEKKLGKLVSPEDGQLNFGPSGIAIHPLTADIFIISAKGNLLLVLNPAGKILHLVKLKKSIHAQPEGICFDADGTLFIANEGEVDLAKIFKFRYQG